MSRSPESKITAREDLAHHLEARRPARIVLANGLFDLLHVGHVRYLNAAREAGDLLIVALNDDASARALRGPSRPIVPLKERMILIAALAAVDYVTWFSEPNMARTFECLRPHRHAKGTDYRPDSLPREEREAHEAFGIEVVCVGDPKSHATTDIVQTVLDGPVE